MEIKLEKITKITVVPTGNIMIDFDDNIRRIYTTDELKAKINNLIGTLESIKRMLDQSQSQSQIQNRIDIDNTLNDIKSSVKQVRKLLNL